MGSNYLGAALKGQAVATKCNAESREGRGCNANDGEPCDSCAVLNKATADYWRGQWQVASPEEKSPAKYAAEMREAGRGHLVRS